MAASGASFRRAFGVAAVAGLTLGVATPAFAATDADCTTAPTFDALAGDDAADIQIALDGGATLICLSGTFLVTTTLDVDHDVTLHGLSEAVLDGGGLVPILKQHTTFSSIIDSTLTVESIRFTRGYAAIGSSGAIMGSAVIIRDSTFDHNASVEVGAVYAEDGVSIENSVFSDNTTSGIAGAAVNFYGTMTVVNSTFERNTADQQAGAIWAYGVSVVTGSTFVDNTSGAAGGAIAASHQISISNSTFVRNRAVGVGAEGGAVAAVAGSIEFSTFVDNSAAAPDGGNSLINYDPVTLRGNIFAGSLATPHISTQADPATDLGGNLFTTASEANLDGSGASTQFSLTTLAIFGANTLASNGGPTQTVAISATGPAVDAVPAGSTVTVDQRGVTRAGFADAGAFEVGARQAALAATGVEAVWLAALAAGLLGLGVAVRRLSARRSRA